MRDNHVQAGRLADRLVPILLVAGALLTAIDVLWAFTAAPFAQGAQLSEPAVIAGRQVTTKLLLSQKIFYLHVPVAVASFAAMAVAAYHALRFLLTKRRDHDRASRTAMQVTLVFIIATMISGDLWTCFDWNTWWMWEPRLTTYFILMLLVIGYFILRNALDDPERCARFSAVFCLVAFIDAPISFMITRLVPSSVHPVVFRTDSGLPPLMLIPFLLGLFGMLMVAFALYRCALRVNRAADEVEELKELFDERAASAQRAAADAALERLRAAGSNDAEPAAASYGEARSLNADIPSYGDAYVLSADATLRCDAYAPNAGAAGHAANALDAECPAVDSHDGAHGTRGLSVNLSNDDSTSTTQEN